MLATVLSSHIIGLDYHRPPWYYLRVLFMLQTAFMNASCGVSSDDCSHLKFAFWKTITLRLLCLAGARVAHLTYTGDRLDELPEKRFAPNDATRELVRGKDATLGHFVDHQVRPVMLAARRICAINAAAQRTESCECA